MAKFVIQALTGPLKNQVFNIRNGLTFGREIGDIVLQDPSVSKIHAEIKINPDGKIMIIDQESKNKIYINDKRIVKSILEKDTIFKIGKSEFAVKLIRSPEEMWFSFVKNQAKKIENAPMALKVFFKPVQVNFYSGLQQGHQYKLYYGPRFFGRHSVDCPVFDRKAPEKSFVLIPEPKKILFKTSYPAQVRMNNEELEKSHLKNGDEVFIGDSVLKVNLG